MMRALWLLCGALAGLNACSVASVAEVPSTIARNQCASDADCPGGSCAHDSLVGDDECRSAKGSFDTMLFEVTPPGVFTVAVSSLDGSPIAGVKFLLDGQATAGAELDLNLPSVAIVTGEVFISPRDCMPKFDDQTGMLLATAGDPSIPALVSLTPSASGLGVFASAVVAPTILANGKNYTFSVNVPPGQYDIYIQPRHQPDASCVVPPELLRNQSINGGSHPLNFPLPEPVTFDLHVSWPLADGGLDGWSADMLDPTSGRVISNRVALALDKGGKSYVASLSYLPVLGDASEVKGQELVRLSPPDGATAPAILLARGALSLFSASSGTLSQFTALPTAVHVEGQVTDGAGAMPAQATVTLVATKVTGIDPGVLASFVATADAGADGMFEVDLLPGTYRVTATPAGDSSLARVTTEWIVGGSPSTQAGKVIELSPTLLINGDALDPAGAPLTGAQVQAVASPASIVTDVLHATLGEPVYTPRAMNVSVQGNGSFALYVDPGSVDFSVRPQASTGFGWLVMANLGVGMTPATSSGLTLGDLAAPWPVSYTGKLTVPGMKPDQPTAVPGALIRSFIYMSGGAYTADSTQADSVLQIGETRSDDNGNFELLIPASLNKAPSP